MHIMLLVWMCLGIHGAPFSLRPTLLPPVLSLVRGMPLFLGQLQSRPPNQYSAILTYRPERPSPRADAILALNLSGTVPLMCFLAEGRILALTGYHVRNYCGKAHEA